MKKMRTVAVCAAMAAGIAARADDNAIRLLVYPVDTLDERMQKQEPKRNLPVLKAPTEGEISKLNGDAQVAAILAKQQAEREQARLANGLALQQFAEAERRAEEIRQKKGSTSFGRTLGNVTDWLAAKLGAYPDVLTVITRTDMQEGEAEKNITNGGGNLVLAACKYKVKPAVSDLNEFEEDVQLPGGTFRRRTLKTTVSIRIERFDEEVGAGTSFLIPVKAVSASGGAVAKRGDDGSFDEAMQKGLEEAAQKIVDYFSANLTVKVRGPKENFEPGDVNLTLDGETIQADSPKRIVKGKYLPKPQHVLQAELDGFVTVTLAEPFNSDTVKTITMKPDNFELTVNVKGPAGDADFNAANAVITLAGGADGDETTLTSGEPSAVKTGKRTLKVELDGYAVKTETFVHSAKSTKTVTLSKAAAVEKKGE
jgi:hypothetical protein